MAEFGSSTPRVICLMGPTGSGKTEHALKIAEMVGGEIVSVDSALVYRGLDIGTAKPGPHERRRIAHHLIDICDPGERYSAARFREDALGTISAIHARGGTAVLTGGTGLYFRALESGLADMPDADEAVRTRLRAALDERGASALHDWLGEVDPRAAARIHPNDPQRLLRALEVYEITGRPLSSLWDEQAASVPAFQALKLILAPRDRAWLHERLERRFDQMLERGFINEVIALRGRGDLTAQSAAMRSVGYRAAWSYLDGALTAAEMRLRGIAASRQLAKRQLTWLRKEPNAHWFDCDSEGLFARLCGVVESRGYFKRPPK